MALQVRGSCLRSTRASTWLNSGTEDIVGPRKVLTQRKEALREHVFDIRHSDHRVQVTMCGQWVMFMLIISTIAMLVVGSAMPSFTMQVQGIVGWAANLGEPGSSVKQVFAVILID